MRAHWLVVALLVLTLTPSLSACKSSSSNTKSASANAAEAEKTQQPTDEKPAQKTAATEAMAANDAPAAAGQADPSDGFCHITADKVAERNIDFLCKLSMADSKYPDGLAAVVYAGHKSCTLLNEGSGARACAHTRVCQQPYSTGRPMSKKRLKAACAEFDGQGKQVKRLEDHLWNTTTSDRYIVADLACDGAAPKAILLKGKTPQTGQVKSKRCEIPSYLTASK